MSLADAKVIVQGQRAKISGPCSPPTAVLHPTHTIFKEFEKTGELPESAKYEGSFQLLQHGVKHSILSSSFYYWTWIACTLKKKKKVFYRNPIFFKSRKHAAG